MHQSIPYCDLNVFLEPKPLNNLNFFFEIIWETWSSIVAVLYGICQYVFLASRINPLVEGRISFLPQNYKSS